MPPGWTSGYYLAVFRLTSGPAAGQTGFTPFIVQAPVGDRSAILVQVPTNTWQAYNTWGGEDLYSSPRAVKVSFDRPYAIEGPLAPGAGRGGGLFYWEYPLVRFLERGGWDVSYATDDDVDRDPSILLDHALDVTAGHDEYWTRQMRDGWDAALGAGVNLAFMGADTGYWQVRYEDGDRTLVSYKSSPDPDTDPTNKTVQFRQLAVPRPECELEGVQYGGTEVFPDYFDYTDATGASDPWFVGTGLTSGSVLPGLVGYETDALAPGCHLPPVTPLLSYPGPPPAVGKPGVVADAVRYTACSGAEVFSAGSLQFSWGLDSWRDPAYSQPWFPTLPPASPALQLAMTRALTDLTRSHVPVPGPPDTCVPTSTFTVSAPQASVRQSIVFSSTAKDRYGQIAGQSWDLTGSGRVKDDSGVTATRSFPSPGHYRVSLRVTDTSGARSTTTKTIHVCRCPAPTRSSPARWPVTGWNARGCQAAPFATLRLVNGRLRFQPDPGIGRTTLRTYSPATDTALRWKRLSSFGADAGRFLRVRARRSPLLLDLNTRVDGTRVDQGFVLPAARARHLATPEPLSATACGGTSARVLTPVFGGTRSTSLRVAVTGRGRVVISVARPGRTSVYERTFVAHGRRATLSFGAPRLSRGANDISITTSSRGKRETIIVTALGR